MSASSVSFNTDVNVRYERLAAEYTKLRAHAKILREGVLVERAKNEKFNEELREKESQLLKLENENETLVFRNEQLVKRVEGLQSDIEIAARAGTKKKDSIKKTKDNKELLNKLDYANNRILVLEEELSNKLYQNEQLTSKVSGLERLHSEELADVTNKFMKEFQELKAELNNMQQRQCLSSSYPSVKAERPVKSVKPMESTETKRMSLLCSDIITHSPSPPPVYEAYMQTAESARNILQGLKTLFQLLHQRSEMYPYDVTMEQLPVHVKKLSSEFSRCSLLFDNPLLIIDECLQNGVIQWLSDIPRFNASLSLVSEHYRTHMPELLNQMAIEESKVSWCDIHLEEKNHGWSSALKRLFSVIDTICSSLETKPLSSDTFFVNLNNVTLVLRDLDSSFHVRWMVESRFPTTTKRFSCIGTALTDCLGKLVIDSAKFTARINAIIGTEQENGMSSKPVGKSLGYHLFDDSNSSEDNEDLNNHRPSLSDSIIHFVDKGTCTVNTEIEQNEKDLNNDDKALQIPLEKTSAVVKDEQINYLKSRIVFLESEREKHLVDLSLLRRKLANLGGKELSGSDDMEFVKKFNNDRLRSMMDAVETAECASRYYKKECEILLRKYYIGMEEKKILKETINDRNRENFKLADELSSVRRGYDSQLARLTEHVADLNGKLVEIEKERIEKEQTPVQTPRGLKSLFLK